MRLILTNEWVYDLYRVTYHTTEEDLTVLHPRFIVAHSEDYLAVEIQDEWPGPHVTYYRYERVAEDVGHPAVIGSIYGRPMYEGGRSHADRVVKRLAMVA